MSQLSTLEDLKDLSGYKKDLKKSLDKVQASPAKMFYAPTFEFKGRKGPMVLVGEIPSGLSKGLKEERVTLKAGRCRRNERGELEVFKGLDPGKIGIALKSAGIAETIAEKEVESGPDEEAETDTKAPSLDARMNRKMEFENEEFRKRAEAAYKSKEKDVLVEVQKFAGENKDNAEALQGIKDVKNEILVARELAAKSEFDEAGKILERISRAVRFTGGSPGTPASEEPTVLGYSSPETGPATGYGQPIPVKQQPGSGVGSAYGQQIPVEPASETGPESQYVSVHDHVEAKPQPQQNSPGGYIAYGQHIPVADEPGAQPKKNTPGGYVAYGQHIPVGDDSGIQRPPAYSQPEIPGNADQAIPYSSVQIPHDAQPDQEEPADDGKRHIDKQFVDKMKGVTIAKGKFGDAAETDDNPHGFKTKPVGQEYVGEHEKATWRKGVDPNDPNYVTRKYSEDERKQKTLDVDAEGNVRNADGTLANVNAEYVLDPKTGKMIKLDMKVEEVSRDPRTGETVRTPAPTKGIGQALKDGRKLEATHHTSPLGGYETDQEGKTVRKGVAGAGGVEIQDGKVKKITNASGHYKPKLVQLLQTLEHLAKQGAILDKTIVDSEGKSLKDSNPRAFALYGAVKKAGENAKQLAAEAKKIIAQMDEADSEEQLQSLGQQLDQINKKMSEIKAKTDSASTLLRKIGAGPSNRIDPGAKVEFVDGKDDLTGIQFHVDAKRTTMSATEFMETGGGNKEQAENKEATLEELTTKTAETRQQLDQEAEKRAKEIQSGSRVVPTDEDFDKALKDLDPGPEAEFEKLGGIPALQDKYERFHGDNPYGWAELSIEEKVEFLKKGD